MLWYETCKNEKVTLEMTSSKHGETLIRTGILIKKLQFGNNGVFAKKVLDFLWKVVYSGIK